MEDKTIADYKGQAVLDKKKISVLAKALKEQKAKTENVEEQMMKLAERNSFLEMENHDSENRYLELYEEF